MTYALPIDSYSDNDSDDDDDDEDDEDGGGGGGREAGGGGDQTPPRTPSPRPPGREAGGTAGPQGGDDQTPASLQAAVTKRAGVSQSDLKRQMDANADKTLQEMRGLQRMAAQQHAQSLASLDSRFVQKETKLRQELADLRDNQHHAGEEITRISRNIQQGNRVDGDSQKLAALEARVTSIAKETKDKLQAVEASQADKLNKLGRDAVEDRSHVNRSSQESKDAVAAIQRRISDLVVAQNALRAKQGGGASSAADTARRQQQIQAIQQKIDTLETSQGDLQTSQDQQQQQQAISDLETARVLSDIGLTQDALQASQDQQRQQQQQQLQQQQQQHEQQQQANQDLYLGVSDLGATQDALRADQDQQRQQQGNLEQQQGNLEQQQQQAKQQ